MKKLITIILMGLYSIPGYCQHSFKQNLANLATITFPDTPGTEQSKKNVMYATMSEGKYYLVEVSAVKTGLRDMFISNRRDGLYSSVIAGYLSRKQGKIFYKKNIVVNGLKGIEFDCSANNNSINCFYYNQAFYLNNTLIIYGISSIDSLRPNDELVKDFFNTFKLTISADKITQDDPANILAAAGYAIGIIIIIIVLSLVVYRRRKRIQRRLDLTTS